MNASKDNSQVQFGRPVTGEFETAETKEWLITNGTGGYGSGTIAGSLSRGYHGLLVSAVNAPVDRRLLLVKLEESVQYRSAIYNLTSNRWASGDISPDGFKNLVSFSLLGSVPCWQYSFSDVILEKKIWMEYGFNTTYVSYTYVSGGGPLTLSGSALVNNRVYHNTGEVHFPTNVRQVSNGIIITTDGLGSQPLCLLLEDGEFTIASDQYNNFLLKREVERGLNANDSHVHAASFSKTINPGETFIFLASSEDSPVMNTNSLNDRIARDNQLIQNWKNLQPPAGTESSDWISQLVLAADQFIVKRSTDNQANGKTVIAGYHWFGDWGRDTMISLPGLTLCTGRHEEAKPVLETFAEYISQGMLPNRFPDSLSQPEYNTIDATLWYFEAIRLYFNHTGDTELLAGLFPKLDDIINWQVNGTRYNIKVDPADHLLSGGETGVQLTWMDAKVGDTVITPRTGKPVEVNALWYNALLTMQQFATALQKDGSKYAAMAELTAQGFQRFWNSEKGYCFDVLDGPNGDESLLRPNQILAVSLPNCPFPADRQKAIVDICYRELYTSHGLRSLAPFEGGYAGTYSGDSTHRDSVYHQGTVWSWLLGPFISAHLKVYKDPAMALAFLEPVRDHLLAAGLGTISEINDGDAPYRPEGCIAQAWSVGQILYACNEIMSYMKTAQQ